MAKQIPDPFIVTPQLVEWADKNVPCLDLAYYTAEFSDYWLGNGKKMANWDATWRNWMRRAYSGGFNGRTPVRKVAPKPARQQAEQAWQNEAAHERAAKTYGVERRSGESIESLQRRTAMARMKGLL